MEDTKKEKEIWELDQDELLNYIYKVKKDFLCMNEEQFNFWKDLLYNKLPDLKDLKFKPKSPKIYPCILRINTSINSSSNFDINSYINNYIYTKYAPINEYTSFPYKGLNGWDIINDFITAPTNLSIYTNTNAVEQYKHSLLNN